MVILARTIKGVTLAYNKSICHVANIVVVLLEDLLCDLR